MIDTLKIELQRAEYAGKTAAECSATLNAKTVNRDRTIIPSYEVVGAIVLSEFTATAVTTKHVNYLTLLVSGGQVDVKNANVRAAMWAIFGSGTQTRTNLAALQTELISRATEIGIPRDVEPLDIIAARGY